MSTLAPPSSETTHELTRLGILQAFKTHFVGDGTANRSPFAADRVVRYETQVQSLDVPVIHHTVRETIVETIKAIQRGETSKVVILAGEAGMGKSHIINWFRSPQLGDELGYIFVGNSNHWKANEFEECLLDWILEALLRPSPNQPHLLLKKIEDLAFQALDQLLARPGQLHKFVGHKDGGWARRVWSRLTGWRYARFKQAVNQRDSKVFERLNFQRFSEFVCERFLPQSSNPVHRYVLQVLLRYLFPAEREQVIHWLRRRDVQDHFLRAIGAKDDLRSKYKVLDTIKILISLFGPDVSKRLTNDPQDQRGRVFLFAFDQIEGRDELFEDKSDWFKFFAQISELYNALPNVFVLFTMTLMLRNELYPKMERQFQQRISRDQNFLLREIQPNELQAVYKQRIKLWLGPNQGELQALLETDSFQFLPFTAVDLVNWCAGSTLRESLDLLHEKFSAFLDQQVISKDPYTDFVVAKNEFLEQVKDRTTTQATDAHLKTLTELLNLGGTLMAKRFGVELGEMKGLEDSETFPGRQLEFRNQSAEQRWIRINVVLVPYKFNAKLKGTIDGLLKGKYMDRNFLWLVRAETAYDTWKQDRPDQIFPQSLDVETEGTFRGMLRLLNLYEGYPAASREKAETVLFAALKKTYLQAAFAKAAEELDAEVASDAPAQLAQPAVVSNVEDGHP
jgi:hypothetical protein